MQQLQTAVGQVRVGPHGQRVGGLQIVGMVAARRKPVNGGTALRQHGQRPHGKFKWLLAGVADLVRHLHSGSRSIHSQRDHFLQTRQSFHRLGHHDGVAAHLDVYRPVVRRIALHGIFGRDPQAVAAARLPLRLARFAELLLIFLEQVLASHEPVPHDAGTDVAGDDRLHHAVRDAIAIGPALVAGFFDFDCRGSAHGQNRQDDGKSVHSSPRGFLSIVHGRPAFKPEAPRAPRRPSPTRRASPFPYRAFGCESQGDSSGGRASTKEISPITSPASSAAI